MTLVDSARQGELPNDSQDDDFGEVVTLKDLLRPEHFRNGPKRIKDQIAQEQTYGLAEALRQSALFTIVLSTLSLVVLWPVNAHGILLGWYGLMLACAIFRHVICVRFDTKQPSGAKLRAWVWLLWVTSFLVGITWCGLVALVWSVGDSPIIGFVALLLVSLALGSFATMGQYIQVYLGSAIPQAIAIGVLLGHRSSGVASAATMGAVFLIMTGLVGASLNGARAWRSIMMFLHKHQALSRQNREKSDVLATILQSIGDGVLTVDRSGLVTYMNPAAERLTGLSLQDVVGKAIVEGFVLTDDAADGVQVNLALAFRQVREAMHLPGELVLRNAKVGAVSVEVTISRLRHPSESGIDHYVVTLHDVTLQRLSVRELSRQASQDPLTGLLNRRGFERRLQEALDSLLSGSASHSFCYIDLDHFKAVNDTCGHQAGDELLKQVVSVMQAGMRDSDVFARLGGDEFGLLL
ncbi:MAG TPA: diguanylate cyclase, partial [Geothrix sp.]